ncbi:MAG TPA: hypothetical protein VMR98_01410 [Candidatus Polarisedimenticolaceae bacterium]|nr:hypothetical protein [Candidatus Polarisedimenticolaceae bacterium]
MDSINDHLRRRAAELGLERGNRLAEIQTYLEERHPGQCRAASLNDGILKITTPNASLASELRLGQVAIAKELGVKVVITIR